ncbi:hypothetical protein F2P81_025270 [Scophthalmus maximus]|uniref:Small ribosomal subunit protein mS23 n=1 Tax=Scophthalmus maximus TaxID=52904 RepID=A0A6A4RQC3_SCOMX|nr:hypothetical protein F2P81_025270 [Scophthalmus maximus]
MAGSRLEKFGTVFNRVRDLMRSGVIQPTEKPLWYDVYQAFPPKRDPLQVKPRNRPSSQKRETVHDIFYQEDEVRAFVNKYTDLKRHSELDESALFEETGKALLSEGLVLRRKGASSVSAESKEPMLRLKLTDMLAEKQSVGVDSKETMDQTTQMETPPIDHSNSKTTG